MHRLALRCHSVEHQRKMVVALVPRQQPRLGFHPLLAELAHFVHPLLLGRLALVLDLTSTRPYFLPLRQSHAHLCLPQRPRLHPLHPLDLSGWISTQINDNCVKEVSLRAFIWLTGLIRTMRLSCSLRNWAKKDISPANSLSRPSTLLFSISIMKLSGPSLRWAEMTRSLYQKQ